MNNYKSAIFAFGLALFFAFSLQAQDAGTLPAKVSAILAKLPAENSADRDALAAELLSLGPKGIGEVCRRLASPGTADDHLARFAISAMANSAAKAGDEARRRMLALKLIRALDEPREAEVKAFLISQLQLFAGEECVKPLGKFLHDQQLGGPASRALQAIGTTDAGKILIRALGRGQGENALPIIQALGEMRSLGAAKKILAYADSQNTTLRQAALQALANIGYPAAQDALGRSAVTTSSYERTSAAPLYLLFARRLWESGKKEASLKICQDFIENYTLPGESQIRASALTLLAEILGEGVFDDLLGAAESPDRQYRQRALELADSIKGEKATARWIEKAAQVPPENQADIIGMLGRRADSAALPFIREKLKSEEKAARVAAIAAAARLGRADVKDDVLPLIRTEDEDQIKAVKQALLVFPSDQILAKAAGLFDEAPPAARIALMEILAERQAKEYAGLVLAQARSEDAVVRSAALAALEPIVRAEDLPQIIDFLLKAASGSEIKLLQNAFIAAAVQISEQEKRAEQILAALEKTKGLKRLDLLRPLAKIGGSKVLEAVVAETKSDDPQIQTAAIYTLSNWLDVGALDPLFKIAGSTAERKFRYLALQGIVRLVIGSDFSAEQKLAYLKNALEMPKEADEKNFVISGLAGVKIQDSLALAAKFLDDPVFQAKAAQTIVRIVLPEAGADGLSGLDAALILKKALLHIENDYDKGRAEKYVWSLLIKDGYTALFNGKDLAGWKGLVEDPVQRRKMTTGELAKAQQEADEFMRRHWSVVDGVLVFDGQGHSLCTLKDFGDFEMFVDWKIEEKGDSGIYLRGSPQVQIWDPAQRPEGSGGLYNNRINPSKPLLCADRPVGEWNTFYIKMTGERVTVYLNGVLVVDNIVMENYWERDKPIYPVGQIELQAHGTPLYFKNIFIREIK
jgi:HEAT repeat protein